MNNTKVYILGAGCSVCGEYPIASHVTKRLLDFARSRLAREDSKELQRCTLDTCRRMMEMGVETIDQLAEKLNGSEPEMIRDAKLAMSIYFLSIEEAAVERALPNYTSFFEELFRYGDNESLKDRSISTPCRVITYNYDRLFERTFIEWAKSIDNDMERGHGAFVREYLNTGIGDPHGLKIETNRFTLLKLHGGVGQYSRDGDYEFKHIYRPKFGKIIEDLIDENHYKPKGYSSDVPTLILPADKKIHGRNQSFLEYMQAVETQALEFCRQAVEIQIIGYSIQAIDYFSFKDMIAQAKHCEKIVIRNRASEKCNLQSTLEKLKDELSAEWKIEFRAEDFFARSA